jgi:alcohol dehydrogenase (cytochrome c)
MAGGALATAADLVFSGADNGHLYAFDARTGAIRWQVSLGLAYGSAPITYAIGGVQYLAVVTGGSSVALATKAPTGGLLYVFKLGGRPLGQAGGLGTTDGTNR